MCAKLSTSAAHGMGGGSNCGPWIVSRIKDGEAGACWHERVVLQTTKNGINTRPPLQKGLGRGNVPAKEEGGTD